MRNPILPLLLILSVAIPAMADPVPFVSGSWTLAILPDTQNYAATYPDVFNAETQWLADNKAAYNLQMVLHEGDVTNNNGAAQWAKAQTSMNKLTAAGIPFLIAPGNHDYHFTGAAGDVDTRSSRINDYFTPPTKGADPNYDVFESGKLENSYRLFSAGGQDYIAIALEFGPRNEVLDWVDSLLTQYSSRSAMFVTHAYLYSDDTRYDWAAKGYYQAWNPHSYPIASAPGSTVNDGQEMWSKVLSKHGNVDFVFNGHVLNDGTGRLDSVGVNGNTVHQILANYQNGVTGMNATSGYLRLLQFLPDGRTVQVLTYSPYHNQWLTDSTNQFTLLVPEPAIMSMLAMGGFTLLRRKR